MTKQSQAPQAPQPQPQPQAAVAAQDAEPSNLPVPLNLDWESPEGIAHHEQMSQLPPDDPVAIAHFRNINKPHPQSQQGS